MRGFGKAPSGKAQLEGTEFTGFYRRYSSRLLGYFMRRVFDPQAAMDLTAETFAQILLVRPRFRGTTEAELESWTFSIARGQLARYVRKGHAERRAVQRLGLQVPKVSDDDVARIEEIADVERYRAAIAAAMEQLTEGQREAVRLRVVSELSYPEVAVRLGISEPNARARVSRGLRTLATTLADRVPVEEMTS